MNFGKEDENKGTDVSYKTVSPYKKLKFLYDEINHLHWLAGGTEISHQEISMLFISVLLLFW